VTAVVLTPAFEKLLSRRCAPCFPKPVSSRGCAFTTHEAPNELRNFIRRGIEREMAPVDDVDFGLRHIPAISLRLRGIIFITAHKDEVVRRRAFQQGAVEFLFKPFSDAALLQALNTALRVRSAIGDSHACGNIL